MGRRGRGAGGGAPGSPLPAGRTNRHDIASVKLGSLSLWKSLLSFKTEYVSEKMLIVSNAGENVLSGTCTVIELERRTGASCQNIEPPSPSLSNSC